MNLQFYVEDQPMQIGTARQLLLDDYMVEDRFRLRRRLHQPIRYPRNPVLCADRPWESWGVMSTNVIYDKEKQLFRMWYNSGNVAAFYAQLGNSRQKWDPKVQGYVGYACYAESEDGVNWRKPNLGIVRFGDFPDTNIVFTGNAGCGAQQVFLDERETNENRRYKMIYDELQPYRGICLAYSPDGIHWTTAPENPLIRGHYDTRNQIVWDADRKRWLMITRPPIWAMRDYGLLGAVQRKGRNLRRNGRCRVAIATSEDLVHWSFPRTMFSADETDIEEDRPDIDSMKVWAYHGLFLGFPTSTNFAGEAGVSKLAFSRDGIHWQQLPGHPAYIAPGREGEFDGGWITTVSNPIEYGGKWWQYYGGYSHSYEMSEYETGIGLVRIHPEGLVEQYAAAEGGFLLTREFTLEGDQLEVNCVLHNPTGDNAGSVQVELITRPGPDSPPVWGAPGLEHSGYDVIPGHSLQDCDPITGSHPHAVVSWKGNTDLSPWRGQAVYLRFFLREAGLFAFQVVDSTIA